MRIVVSCSLALLVACSPAKELPPAETPGTTDGEVDPYAAFFASQLLILGVPGLSVSMVRDGEVWTSTGEYCLDGITRRKVLDLCSVNEIPAFEKDFTLDDVRSADEAFVTGTFAGLTPVVSFDGKAIGEGIRGPMCERLQNLYIDLVRSESSG